MSTNPHTRNFYNSIGNSDDVKANGSGVLRIGLDYRFVRYFIEQDDVTVYYGEYALQSVTTDADLRGQVESILSKDAFLSRQYAEVRICWSTDFEIVPTAFYDDTIDTSDAGVNDILDGEAKFLFEKTGEVSALLDARFPDATHYHSGTALIETIRRNGLATSGDLYVNIGAQQIEVLYFDTIGALKIYNRYEYRTYQDYIYFVLLVADELQIDRDTARAVLMGEVSADSQLYEVTGRYFRQVSFIKQSADRRFSSSFGEYPVHFNYPLYNL